jgi:sec-independent protein translocase protein TatA
MIRNLLDHPINLLIVVLVIVAVVGWKRLPDVARSLGRSMRIFKSEIDEMKKEEAAKPSAASSDTVKGETVHPTSNPTSNPTADPIQDPTKMSAADATEREQHSRPPA